MGGLVDAVFGGGDDAPDPYAVARAQGQANIEAARVTAMMNRADQITPWGSQLWSQTPICTPGNGYKNKNPRAHWLQTTPLGG